jgi:hypothetical protein
MNTIVQIAPQLPPAVDGVGDYSWQLAGHWPVAETRFRFLVLHGAEATRAHAADADVSAFAPDASSLHEALEKSGARVAVLHYVGYGYQPKGIPVWLPAALEEWRHEGSARRLVTMFHEMYATSSPLRSPFWVKPWAQRIMQRLVNASDAWVTSCSRYFDWLGNEFHAEPARGMLLPIAPNVPAAADADLDRLWPIEFGRKLRVAIFGLPKTRLDALARHQELLSALVRAEVAESILLIGKSDVSPRYTKRLRGFQRRIGGEWRTHSDLPPAQAAEVLASCDVGCVANDVTTLTKSGVFAALAINAVACVAAGHNASLLPEPFNQFVILNDERPQSIDDLIRELKEAAQMTVRRRLTREMARAELSWTRVAASWKDLVNRAVTASERNAEVVSPNLNHPSFTEVRA